MQETQRATIFPLGVCVLPAPLPNRARTCSYGSYIHEILRHAGLCYGEVAFESLAQCLPQLRILVTVGESEFPEPLREQLCDWVQKGGAWLSVGGACGLIKLFDGELDAPAFFGFGGGVGTLGEGYLQCEAPHPVLAHLQKPLHFFNGLAVRADAPLASVLDAHGRPTARAALLENEVGKGRCLLIAPDVTGTIVRVQQGRAITQDGVSAPDGSAPTNDGVLKSDDGMVLDWIFDRDPVPDAPGLQGFLHPVADCWREVLFRAVFHLAVQQGVTLPLLWLYPRGLPALGHISLDSDGNDPQLARLMLATLEKAQSPATWCVILPGYDTELIDEIRQSSHEPAMHFDAMSEGLQWDETSFDQQWRALTELFGGEAPVTNKNHYLRWQGDIEFFEWCIARGLLMDQSKGASKTGEAGFNFGTCHPYRPVAPDGSLLPIYEMPTPTQDLMVFAPEALLAPLLDAALQRHGILHLLFHPAHIAKEGVAESLLHAVAAGKAKGLEWWTAKSIVLWEEARRGVRWHVDENKVTLTAAPDKPLHGATILMLAPPQSKVFVNGQASDSTVVERWGFTFHSVVLDISGNESLHLEIKA